MRELDKGHTCVPIADPPSSVKAGANATLQIKYISEFDKPENETFYACADITYVALSDFKDTIPCFNVTQPPLKTKEAKPPQDSDIIRLKCDIHPWMAAWVVVNPNRFFATSGADGSFSIEHLPAGTYTLEAWHETLGIRTAEITLKEGETVSASFEFSAPAPASASGGVK